MKKILVLGGGRSATVLIHYLSGLSRDYNFTVHVADLDLPTLRERIGTLDNVLPLGLDVSDLEQREAIIGDVDVIISLVPPGFHKDVALSCIKLGKHMLCASYLTDEIQQLSQSAEDKNVFVLMECGLDPGIDHMTAMQAIHQIQAKDGRIFSYKSFTGGLVAPDSDDNPWHYKFTWNPKNVITAGQGAVKFIRNGRLKYVPYHQLFNRLESVNIPGFGDFEGYPNRDSLKYRSYYGLEGIPTILRGTLRRPGFSKAWNCFVQLGITDDTYQMENSAEMTYRAFINTFLYYDRDQMVEDKLCHYLGLDKTSEVFQQLVWTGVFEEKPIGIENATPAQVLLELLSKKWSLSPDDKDMVVMQHQFQYELNGKNYQLTSSMVSLGDDQSSTAMSKTVGYPLGIAAIMLLENKIKATGVHIPTKPFIYEPIIEELKKLGIQFLDEEKGIDR